MRRYLFIVIGLICLHISLPGLQAAVYTPKDVPDPKVNGQEYYVSDPDTLLADSTIQWLNRCAGMLDDSTHVELCVVALTSIGDQEAFEFAYELFQRWGIGREGQNTGVLMLFVLESHDLRIITGTGIEGVLTDALCSQIIHDDMFPAFRNEDYDGGLCLGVLRIYEICTNGDAPEELLTIRSATNRGHYADPSNEASEWSKEERITVICLVVAVILIIIACWFATIKRCPKCKKRKAHAIKRHTITAATYTHSGEEEVTYCCKNCGHTFVLREILPRLSKSSSSSSSGGGGYSGGGGGSWGGGSTSGGGAGGKW